MTGPFQVGRDAYYVRGLLAGAAAMLKIVRRADAKGHNATWVAKLVEYRQKELTLAETAKLLDTYTNVVWEYERDMKAAGIWPG